MDISLIIKIFLLNLVHLSKVISLQSSFFENGIEYQYSCNAQFDYPRNFDCACLSGLWNLHTSDCKDVITLGGDNQYCVDLSPSSGFTRIEQLLPDRNHVLIKKHDGSTTVFKEGHQPDIITLNSGDTIIAGKPWNLEDEDGNEICLAASARSYCYFSVGDLGLKSISRVRKGCPYASIYAVPTNCTKISSENKDICRHRIQKRSAVAKAKTAKTTTTTKKPEDAEAPSTDEETTTLADEETTTLTAIVEDEVTTTTATSITKTTPASIPSPEEHGKKPDQKGRVFFGGPGMNSSIFSSNLTEGEAENSTKIFDEDFFNTTSMNLTTADDTIASEIWNFIDAKLDEILGLKETEADDNQIGDGRIKRATGTGRRASSMKGAKGRNTPVDSPMPASTPEKKTLKSYRSPVYQFLELTKEVMQKTCPSGYVTPGWFDLSISTFIKMQKKHFKFPEGATNYFGYWRIAESLKSCINNVTAFNFTTDNCTSKEKPVTGNFCAFGNCSEEISIRAGFENFDPLIETVWNVFKNAHAACFSFFNQRYNDHHRFTMWMLPLFQNQVNDIWKNGSSKGVAYGGVFGNQENVQAAIAYCSAASTLQTKYPWDLPRPNKIEELANAGATGRRKRDIFEREIEYNIELDPANIDLSAQCISPEKPLTC